MDVLNNRELATVIYLILLLVWSFTKPTIRQSLMDVAKAFLTKSIIVPFSMMALYLVIIILLLSKVGLWNSYQLKNSLIWFVSTAMVSFLRLNLIPQNPNYFMETVKDNLKLLVVLEFLISFYTFDLWIELIIVPLIVILGGMLTISQSDKKYQSIEKLINSVMVLSGAFLVIYTIYKLATDFGEFAKVQTLYDFAIPPLLTFLLIPFIYFMVLCISYENAFVRLNLLIKDPALLRYAKFKSAIEFNMNFELMKRWVNSLTIKGIEAKDELKLSIDKINSMSMAEKYPEEVPLSKGWSPYAAKDFLIEEGIETGYYQPHDLDEWFALSPFKEIEQKIISNNIAYYINGDVSIAKSLKIQLNVNVKESALPAHQKLLDIAKLLYAKSLLIEMPLEVEDAILSGCNKTFQINDKIISVTKSDWIHSNNDGYDIKFIIEHLGS